MLNDGAAMRTKGTDRDLDLAESKLASTSKSSCVFLSN